MDVGGSGRHWQRFGAREQGIVAPVDLARINSQAKVRELARERTESGAQLQASEMGTDAEVVSKAEGHMTASRAMEIDSIRVGKVIGIAVGRTEDRDHCLAPANVLSAERCVPDRPAPALPLHRTGPAQQF